jgi:DNA-binding MarR family transcriptional regulator
MSDDVGFLISDTARLLRRAFDERARSLGITRPQWRVLTLLGRFGGCTQAMLADRLDVEPITAARMIDRLQEAGLVERCADPNDRRAWRLHLTKGGETALLKLRPLALDLFDEALFGLSDEQISELEATLNAIQSNLSRRSAEVING